MKKPALILAALAVMLGIAFFIGFAGYAGIAGNAVKAAPAGAGVKEFEIKAFRFGYSPDTMNVNAGDNVRIKIDNTDTMHGIIIPELGVSGTELVEFKARKAGTYEWFCNIPCGPGHRDMRGRLVVS